MGRSALLQPIYARSHDTQTGDDHSLSVGLRSALSALAHIIDDIQPRFMPNAVQPVLQAVIFADAYVKIGERIHKAGYVPTNLPLPAHDRDDNGWGYVVRIGQVVYYDHGITPRSVLNAITSRRAFIYALEVYAQLMALFTLAGRLPAGRSLTTRPERLPSSGRDTKDAFVNGMLAAFWGTAARCGWRPVRPVKSKANVADAVERRITRSKRISASKNVLLCSPRCSACLVVHLCT